MTLQVLMQVKKESVSLVNGYYEKETEPVDFFILFFYNETDNGCIGRCDTDETDLFVSGGAAVSSVLHDVPG